MKCVTSSLFRYLSEHQEVALCQIKEPHFFNKNSNWQKGFNWYQSLWNYDPKIHKIALEASIGYTKLPCYVNTAERIAETQKKFKINFKFIYIMRHPIERMESQYNHEQQAKRWNLSPVEQEIDIRAIEICKYAKQIDEYSKLFPKNSILLLNF